MEYSIHKGIDGRFFAVFADEQTANNAIQFAENKRYSFNGVNNAYCINDNVAEFAIVLLAINSGQKACFI